MIEIEFLEPNKNEKLSHSLFNISVVCKPLCAYRQVALFIVQLVFHYLLEADLVTCNFDFRLAIGGVYFSCCCSFICCHQTCHGVEPPAMAGTYFQKGVNKHRLVDADLGGILVGGEYSLHP